jgi:hypothetical protein
MSQIQNRNTCFRLSETKSKLQLVRALLSVNTLYSQNKMLVPATDTQEIYDSRDAGEYSRDEGKLRTVQYINLSFPVWRLASVRTLPDRRSELMATDPEVRVRFPALPDFLRSGGSGTGPTQPREYNWGATVWKTENKAVGIRCAHHATPSIRKSWY